MEFGIAVASKTDSWKVVERAEDLGFTSAWFYDTQMLNADVFVAMAAAAMKTSRIRLGTGVLIPSNRIAPVTANALASLNQLAPGRIDFGVGTGFTGRRTMGLTAMKLAEMTEYIRIVYGLLNEETVEWEFEGKRRKIRFLDPTAGAINTQDPIRLHVSAFGPKTRRVAAELGGAWINFANNNRRAVNACHDMAAAWQEAGRPAAELYRSAITIGRILEEGEPFDSPRAKAEAGPLPAAVLHDLVESDAYAPGTVRLPSALRESFEKYRALYQAYGPEDARYLTLHRGHMMYLRDEERDAITAELIEDLSFTGRPERLREKLEEMRAAGYDQWIVQITHGQEDAIDGWARLFEDFR